TSPRRLRLSLAGALTALVVLAAFIWWGAAPECAGGFVMFCLPRGLTLLLPAWTLAEAAGETGGPIWWTILLTGTLATLALLLAIPYTLAATAASLLRRSRP
ncbi:MAG TPA: hypothetical protein VFN74_02115, partial [Chloroflexota bacterium]|nr:hypothetical protein [Chloroflexota bacterium]